MEYALQLLHHTELRPGQAELISAISSGRDVFGILPVGDERLCWLVPATLSDGLTVVISRQTAAVHRQVEELRRLDIAADYLDSTVSPWQTVLLCRRLTRGDCRLLYIAPERLPGSSFLTACLRTPVSLVVVEEAECLSRHSERYCPDYDPLVPFLSFLPVRPVVAAFSAAAAAAAQEEIPQLLSLRDPLCITPAYDRPNLSFHIRRTENRLAELAALVQERVGKRGVIFCENAAVATAVESMLRLKNVPDVRRADDGSGFPRARSVVLVAAESREALSYVIHSRHPACPEDYFREAGFAGRNGSPAECILLCADSDCICPPMQADPCRSSMTDYVRSDSCLSIRLLSFFGQMNREPCGHCSVCLRQEAPAQEPRR